MVRQVTETFFLPDEVGRTDWTLPADIFNLARRLLARSSDECVFVPIRSMQYLGVVTHDEIVFVDSLAYACQGKQGGRLIMVAWKFTPGYARDSLDAPVPCQVVTYKAELDEVVLRLVGDFRQAMELLDKRYRDSIPPGAEARIIQL